jgi:hypothetical protein
MGMAHSILMRHPQKSYRADHWKYLAFPALKILPTFT